MHPSLLLDIDILPFHGPPLWCLNLYWLEGQTVQGTCTREMTECWKCDLNTVNPDIEWEAFKTSIRDTFMSITGMLRKNTKICTEELESAMLKAGTEYNESPTSHTHSRRT